MCFHCEPLALDEVLTWMVEVELLQGILAVTHLQRVTFGEAELDGVAIVDDFVWSLAPSNLEWWLPRTDSAGNVDGRLLTARPTRRVSRIETTHLLGPASPS
jgi:hypothetical protein